METAGNEGRKILVIDDDSVMQRLFSTVLHRAGHDVLIAQSGLAGIEVARREHPHLIILDYVMPDMDGLETLKELKGDDATKSIPVMIATGYLDAPTSQQFLTAGAAACLPKPFEPAALLNVVDKLIRLTNGSSVALAS